MTNDEAKVILQRIDNIASVVDRIDRDLAQDRKELQQFTIRLGNVELQIEELRKIVSALPQKTQDKVAETMQPMIEEAQNLGEKIEKKTFRILREPFSWKKLFNKKGGI